MWQARISALVCASLVGGSVARGEPVRRDLPPKNYANMRTGVATLADRAVMCLELSPLGNLAPITIEGCGTGAGFLHTDPDPEIAHFRGKWTITSARVREATLQPVLGFGFAELQIDRDSGGFSFFGTDASGASTAGLEATAALRSLWSAGAGLDFIAELAFSLGYLPHAPDLVRPHDSWQPTAMFTFGIGY